MRTKKFPVTNSKEDVVLNVTEAVYVAHISPVGNTDKTKEDDLSDESCKRSKKRAATLKMGIAFVDRSLSSDESDSKETTRKKRGFVCDGSNLHNVVYDGSLVEPKSNNLFMIDRSGVNDRLAVDELDWNDRIDRTSRVEFSVINADFVSLERRSNEGMANGAFDVVDADVSAHERPVNEGIADGEHNNRNINRNGVVAVNNIDEFKVLGSRYHKFCCSLRIELNSDAPEYIIGPEVEEVADRAKFHARNDIRIMVNDLKVEREREIQNRYGNVESVGMTNEVADVTTECVVISVKLNKFVDSLTECASLDFGFCLRGASNANMCYCPCSATTKVFRELFLTYAPIIEIIVKIERR